MNSIRFLQLLCLCATFLSGCGKPGSAAGKNSTPVAFEGSIYRSLDGRIAISISSDDELELRDGGTNIICKYTIQGETVRAVAEMAGTTQALYFRKTAEGLVGQDNITLFNPALFAQISRVVALNGRLIEAATKGDAAGEETSLNQGASLNARDSLGRNALQLAITSGVADAVQVLMKHGQDPNTLIAGECALDFFLGQVSKSTEIGRVLLESGADPNYRGSNKGITPLMIAASNAEGEEMVKLLLARKADINAVDADNATPLWYSSGKAEMMHTLVEAGANRLSRNVSGKTILEWASGNPLLLRALMTDEEVKSSAALIARGGTALIGTWRIQNVMVTYSSDGLGIERADDGGSIREKWAVQGGTLRAEIVELNGQKLHPAEIKEFRLLYITPEFLILRDGSSGVSIGFRVQEGGNSVSHSNKDQQFHGTFPSKE